MKPGQRVKPATHLILKQLQSNSQRYRPCWETWTTEVQRNQPKVCYTLSFAPPLTLFGMLIILCRRCVPHRHTHTCKPFTIIQRSSRFGSNSFSSPTSRSTGPTLRTSFTTHYTVSLISFNSFFICIRIELNLNYYSSPQFRAAVSNFDQALRTGLLGGLVRSLGLPEEAGTGIRAFLRAIQEQADRERSNNSSMDTD